MSVPTVPATAKDAVIEKQLSTVLPQTKTSMMTGLARGTKPSSVEGGRFRIRAREAPRLLPACNRLGEAGRFEYRPKFGPDSGPVPAS